MVVFRLMFGLFLYAIGIGFMIRANIGLAPWEVFHQGMSFVLPITMGQAIIIVGAIILVFNHFLGEKIGWGTVANVLFIGIFLDGILASNVIPSGHNVIVQILMVVAGMLIVGFASWLYIGSMLGAGPRDGLMVALTKRTGKSVAFIRGCIEVSVLIIGYFLGGKAGIGTIFISLTLGYFVQLAFKIVRFDVKQIKHRYIADDVRWLKGAVMVKEDMEG